MEDDRQTAVINQMNVGVDKENNLVELCVPVEGGLVVRLHLTKTTALSLGGALVRASEKLH